MPRSSRPFRSSVAFALLVAAAFAISVAPAVASPVPFTGEFVLQFGSGLVIPAGGGPPTPFHWPVSGVADVSGGQLSLPAGALSETGSLWFPFGFPLNLITGYVVTVANQAGTFSVGGATALCPGPSAGGAGACVVGGGFGGGMPVAGVLQIKGGLAINVPLSVIGVNGELVQSLGGIVVQGAPWTTRTARITTTGAPMAMLTQMGSALGALGAASSTLNLVSPAHINSAGISRTPAFSTLSLHFVPEPGGFALLGVGLAGIATAARSRRRPRV